MDFKEQWDIYNKSPVQAADPSDLKASKVFAILSYFWILFFLPLVCCKDSPFGRFHANQGLLSFIFGAVTGACLKIVGLFYAFIPIFGGLIIGILSVVVGLVNLFFMIVGIVNAAEGKYRRLPLIGQFDIIK